MLADAVRHAARQIGPPLELTAVLALWSGLRADVEDLEGTGYLLDLGPRGGEIVVRRADSYPRRRFTVAHEIGHWLLGSAEGDTDLDIEPQQIERWCDAFAVALLLPQNWVRDVVAGSPAGGNLAEQVALLPRTFGTSKQATMIRIAELTELSLVHLRLRGPTTEVRNSFVSRSVSVHQIAGVVRSLVARGLTKTASSAGELGVEITHYQPSSDQETLVAIRPQEARRHAHSSTVPCVRPELGYRP